MANLAQTPETATDTADIRLMNTLTTVLVVLVVLGALAGVLWKASRMAVFNIQGIQVSGHPAHTTAQALRAQVLPQLKGNFFSVNIAQARDAFMQEPWVRRAVVQRVFPNQLAVKLEEHEEVAYWGKSDANQLRLLNRQGEVFAGDPNEATQSDLPFLSGPDTQSANVLLTYRHWVPLFKTLNAQITALDMDARGSWSVVLNEATHLNVGTGTEQELAARINQFIQTVNPIMARYQRSFADLEYADLRYKTGYALRMRGVTTVDSKEASRKQPATH